MDSRNLYQRISNNDTIKIVYLYNEKSKLIKEIETKSNDDEIITEYYNEGNKDSIVSKINNIFFYKKDFNDSDFLDFINDFFKQNKVDIVLSDMAVNTTGNKDLDAIKTNSTALDVVNLSKLILKPKSSLLVKIFSGMEENILIKNAKVIGCRHAMKF